MSKSIGSIALEHRVDALFSRYTQPGSPGAVVAVMRSGEIELCKGYGLASIELGVPIEPRTRFRIASVSKQFTVSAALMLAEEGSSSFPIRRTNTCATKPPHHHRPDDAQLSSLPDFLNCCGWAMASTSRRAGHLLAAGAQQPSQLLQAAASL
jgi:hypothetical protein